MTYTRPGTSTVNALQLPQPYQPLGSPDEQRVRVTSNGPLLDFINPAQAGRNAGQDAAAISNFLDTALKVGGPILAKSLEERAQTEATDFLNKNTNIAALYGAADQAGRDTLRSLSGRAQDIVGTTTAQAAANEYLQIYRANRSNSRVFISPGAPPEQVAAADAKAKEAALNQSGLSAIPSRYLANYTPGILEGEGRIRAEGYTLRLEEERKLTNERFSDAYSKLVRNAIDDRIAGLASAGGAGTPEGVDFALRWRDGQAKYYEGELKRVLASEVYTPQEFAQIVFNGWKSAIISKRIENDANGDPDVEGLLSMVQLMRGVTSTDVKTADGVSLWELDIGEGGSIRDRLGQMEADLQPEYERWKQKQALLPFMPNLVGIAQGAPGAREAAINALPMLSSNPEAFQNVLGLLSQTQSTANTSSKQQDVEYGKMLDQMNAPNRDRNAMSRAIAQMAASGRITIQQANDLRGKNQENTDPSAAQAYTGIARNEAEIRNAATQIFKQGVASGRITLSSGQSASDVISQIEVDLRSKVQRQTTERIKALRTSGKDVTDTQAYEFSRDFVDSYREEKIKSFGDSGNQPQMRTPAQRALETAQTVQANLNRTGGVGTIAVFPPDVINAAKAAGVPIDYRNVQKFYLRQLAGFKDTNGKPLFPDPQKAYQEMVKRAQEEARRRGGARPIGPQSAAPQQAPSVSSNPVGTFLQGLAQSVGLAPVQTASRSPGTSSQPAQPRSGGGQQRGQQATQRNPVERFLSGALGAAVGVLDQPVSAAELPAGQAPGGGRQPDAGGGTRNMTEEGMAVMASLWRGVQPMTPTTPPLPQVDGAAMAPPIQFAISNPNHPFFVAIGINEGTRTPSGGYTSAYYGHTDPGNGKHNVGTVSGQQGGTPQSTDRRWMGTLTQRQLQMAPVLQQLGLQPGSVAFNRVMFNVLDLTVQAPAAVPDFIRMLPRVVASGASIEAIAKARTDSFINPATGRLEASGFGNNYSRLFADQRSRAGAFDYKRRF
jgi:hypothetical protein